MNEQLAQHGKFNKSIALLVAVQNYAFKGLSLNTPLADAKRLREVLTGLGYAVEDVKLLPDPTRTELEAALKRISDTATENDRLLFYFAGHATTHDVGTMEAAGYLLLQDAVPGQPGESGGYYSMASLLEWVNDLPCHHALLLLDCCFAEAIRYSNVVRQSMSEDVGRASFGPAPMRRPTALQFRALARRRARQVITSASANQKADDTIAPRFALGADSGSPFTTFLIKALSDEEADSTSRDQDRVTTADELYAYLRFEVSNVTRDRGDPQTPALFHLNEKDDNGNYFFSHIQSAEELEGGEISNPFREGKPYLLADHKAYGGYIREARAEIERVTAALAAPHGLRLWWVIGASGSGKSSFALAGVGYRWLTEGLAERQSDDSTGENRRAVAILRFDAEQHGWKGFVSGLTEAYTLAPDRKLVSLPFLTSRSGASPEDLAEALASWEWLRGNAERRLLVIVDQLECLIRRAPAEERAWVEKTLAAWLDSEERVRVVVTLRADYQDPGWQIGLRPRWEPGNMTALDIPEQSDLIQMVRHSAAAVGLVNFVPEYLNAHIVAAARELVVLSDVDYSRPPPEGRGTNAAGPLPLLAATLSRMFEKALEHPEDLSFSQADYAAVGNVYTVLVSRTEAVLRGLDPAEKTTMRRVMVRMVDTQPRSVPLWELEFADDAENERVAKVLDALLTNYVLVADWNPYDSRSEIAVAHPYLIDGWEQMSPWRQEESRHYSITLHRNLSRVVEQWLRPADTHAARLGLLRQLWDDNPVDLLPAVRALRPAEAPDAQLDRPVTPFDEWWSALRKGATPQKQYQRLQELAALPHTGRLLQERERMNGARMARRPLLALTGVPLRRMRRPFNWLAWFFFTPLASPTTPLNHREVSFVQASERRRRIRTLRQQVAYVSVLLVLLAATLVWVTLWSQATRSSRSNFALLRATEAQVALNDGDILTAQERAVEGAAVRNTDAATQDNTYSALAAAFNDPRQLRHLLAHTGAVREAAWAPDSRHLLTGGADGQAVVWDTLTGSPVARLPQRDGAPVGAVAWVGSADQIRLATGNDGGQLQVWDDSYTLRMEETLDGAVNDLAWDLSGTRLAVAAENNQALVWPHERGAPVLLEHSGPVNRVLWSVDGQLITASARQAFVWSSTLSTPVYTFTLPPGEQIQSIAWSPTGGRVAVAGSDNRVRVWPGMGDNAELHLLDQADMYQVIWSPDAKYLVAGSAWDRASVWNVNHSDCLELYAPGLHNATTLENAANSSGCVQYLQHAGNVYGLAWLKEEGASGATVVSAGEDHTIQFWDGLAGTRKSTVRQGEEVRDLVWSPDGRTVAALGSGSRIGIWSFRTDIALTFPYQVYDTNWSANDELLISGSQTGEAIVWDAVTAVPLMILRHDNAVKSVLWSPDGQQILTTSDDWMAQRWSASTGDRLGGPLPHPGYVRWGAWSRDQSYLATGTAANAALLWRASDGTRLHTLPYLVPSDSVGVANIVWSPDGQFLAMAVPDGGARVWDVVQNGWSMTIEDDLEAGALAWSADQRHLLAVGLADGLVLVCSADESRCSRAANEHVHMLTTLTGAVKSLAWSSSGALAAGDRVGQAAIWEEDNLRATLPHPDSVDHIAWSPDGTILATAGRDGKARLWDAERGNLLGEVQHSKRVVLVRWSHDGRWFATASIDGSARRWPTDTNQLRLLSCERIPRTTAARPEGAVETSAGAAFCPPYSRPIGVAKEMALAGDVERSRTLFGEIVEQYRTWRSRNMPGLAAAYPELVANPDAYAARYAAPALWQRARQQAATASTTDCPARALTLAAAADTLREAIALDLIPLQVDDPGAYVASLAPQSACAQATGGSR